MMLHSVEQLSYKHDCMTIEEHTFKIVKNCWNFKMTFYERTVCGKIFNVSYIFNFIKFNKFGSLSHFYNIIVR
jgi:hypothetical protein